MDSYMSDSFIVRLQRDAEDASQQAREAARVAMQYNLPVAFALHMQNRAQACSYAVLCALVGKAL